MKPNTPKLQSLANNEGNSLRVCVGEQIDPSTVFCSHSEVNKKTTHTTGVFASVGSCTSPLRLFSDVFLYVEEQTQGNWASKQPQANERTF